MGLGSIGQVGGALFLAAVACAPRHEQRSATEAPTRVEIPVASGADSPALPEAPPPATLPEIVEPKAPACRFSASSWSSRGSLRLDDGMTPFASVLSVPTAISLPPGPARAAVGTFDDGEVLVRGLLPAAEVSIFLARPRVLSGFLVPKGHAPVRWSNGAAGELRVAVDAKGWLASPEIVEDAVPCADFDLSPAYFPARELLTKQKRLPEKLVQSSGAVLSTTSGGSAAAALLGGQRVEVLEARQGSVRLLIDAPKLLVFGWVRAQDLRPAAPSSSRGRLGGSHRTRRPAMRGGRTCLRDLSLVAEVGERRARVGVLRAGTRFDPVASEPDPAKDTGAPPPRHSRSADRLRQIQLPRTRWLVLGEDAHLAVFEDELRACEKAPESPPPPRDP